MEGSLGLQGPIIDEDSEADLLRTRTIAATGRSDAKSQLAWIPWAVPSTKEATAVFVL